MLGFDVGFYVFSLPFWQMLRGVAQVLVVLAALVAGGLVSRLRQPDVGLRHRGCR